MAGIEFDGVNNKIELNTGAAAADQHILFNGNAQDFYIGLDDSADDLIIGLGSTVGTTPIISVDENKDVAIPDGGLTITTSDNTDTLTLISTDADANAGPNLNLYRNSSSPADNDLLGSIKFTGEDDASNIDTFLQMNLYATDVSNSSEDIQFEIDGVIGGTLRNFITMQAGSIVLNEDSQDIDFRVESNGNANMLFVDGGNDRVGIGTASPASELHIEAASTPKLTIRTVDGTSASIKLQRIDADDAYTDFELKNDGGVFKIISDNNSINERALVNFESAEITFNEDSADIDFRVESNDNANMLFIDAGSNEVGIGVNPSKAFHTAATANNIIVLHHNEETSGNVYGLQIDFSSTVDDNTSYFFRCVGNDRATVRAVIYSDGDIQNADNSYGSTSDERIKEQIKDANSQWGDIKALKIKNYKLKEDVADKGDSDDLWRLGVIAQDLETAGMNGLVKPEVKLDADSPEVVDGKGNVGDIRDYKGVKYSILYMKAVKALQECMARIEALEG